MVCINCREGLPWECTNILNGAPCDMSAPPVAEEVEEEENDTYKNRTYKREGTLRDQQSTGRKRAAKLYPLDETAPCEWRGLKNAGGSKVPIIGCHSGLQQARHHGPDKNTLNNDKGNVHRICNKCHNRWHTRNDPVYDAGSNHKPHDGVTEATIDEIAMSEVYWVTTKTVKAKD